MSKEVLIKILENIQANEIKSAEIVYITKKAKDTYSNDKVETITIK